MIVFRADANPNIGMSHIMRCLSVADSASSKHQVIFILADDGVEGLVKGRGYETFVLHTDYTKMEEEVWPQLKPSLIIVDSYFVTAKYLQNLRTKAKVAYIDDILSFSYGPIHEEGELSREEMIKEFQEQYPKFHEDYCRIIKVGEERKID